MRNHLRITGHETIKHIQYKFWEINPILRLLNENSLFWEHSQTLYIRRYRLWQSDTNSLKNTRTTTQAIRISLALPPLYDGISSVENPVTKLAYICGKATSLRLHSIDREHGNQATSQVCLKSQLLIFFYWITPLLSPTMLTHRRTVTDWSLAMQTNVYIVLVTSQTCKSQSEDT